MKSESEWHEDCANKGELMIIDDTSILATMDRIPCKDIIDVIDANDGRFIPSIYRQVFFYQILTLKSHDYHNTIIGAQNTAVLLQIQ